MSDISQNIQKILKELPGGVKLVAAAKTRTAEEVIEAINAGITIIGENYVQEAEEAYNVIGKKAKWHFIGSLQKNKINKALSIFDVIETVDSKELALAIDKRCEGRDIDVFIEINSGRETQKSGVFPEDAINLIKEVSMCENLKVTGLMTMGPYSGDPEEARPYFKETKKIFDLINKEGIHLEYLSMGMSNSYKIAVEEGANIVRIGTKIFGERDY